MKGPGERDRSNQNAERSRDDVRREREATLLRPKDGARRRYRSLPQREEKGVGILRTCLERMDSGTCVSETAVKEVSVVADPVAHPPHDPGVATVTSLTAAVSDAQKSIDGAEHLTTKEAVQLSGASRSTVQRRLKGIGLTGQQGKGQVNLYIRADVEALRDEYEGLARDKETRGIAKRQRRPVKTRESRGARDPNYVMSERTRLAKTSSDRHCAECHELVNGLVVKDDDRYCSTECCRAAHGVTLPGRWDVDEEES